MYGELRVCAVQTKAGPFLGSNDPCTGVTYQIPCRADIYIRIHNSRKITAMKSQQTNFLDGVGGVTTAQGTSLAGGSSGEVELMFTDPGS